MKIDRSSHPPGTSLNPFCHDCDESVWQKFLLFGLCVAGKNASIQQAKVDEMCYLIESDLKSRWPRKAGRAWKKRVFNSLLLLEPDEGCRVVYIEEQLRKVRMGQYGRLTRAILWVTEEIKKDFRFCSRVTRDELCKCVGMGYKTASFYKLYTDREWIGAVLDTHILKWLKKLGYDVPKTTPPVRQYKLLENHFLAEAMKAGKGPKDLADFDFELWSKYAQVINET